MDYDQKINDNTLGMIPTNEEKFIRKKSQRYYWFLHTCGCKPVYNSVDHLYQPEPIHNFIGIGFLLPCGYWEFSHIG